MRNRFFPSLAIGVPAGILLASLLWRPAHSMANAALRGLAERLRSRPGTLSRKLVDLVEGRRQKMGSVLSSQPPQDVKALYVAPYRQSAAGYSFRRRHPGPDQPNSG